MFVERSAMRVYTTSERSNICFVPPHLGRFDLSEVVRSNWGIHSTNV